MINNDHIIDHSKRKLTLDLFLLTIPVSLSKASGSTNRFTLEECVEPSRRG